MKLHPMAWIITAVFAVILAVGLLERGTMTGQAAGGIIPAHSGVLLSVVAALLAIGVLFVAGFQEVKK